MDRPLDDLNTPASHPDRTLYLAWLERSDQSAAKRLYRRHYWAAWRFFRNKLTDPQEVLELISETFTRFFANLAGFIARATPEMAALSARPLLLGIARNVLLEHLRKVYRRGELELGLRSLSELLPRSLSSIVTARHELEALAHGLRSLPLPDQILVEAKYFEYLSTDELAGLLEIPASTVPGRLRGAKQRLLEAVRAHLSARGQGSRVCEAADSLDAWIAELRREASHHVAERAA